MEKFDCIIVGAGNAGLIAGLELAKKNKKVLVLEKGNTPGGMATSFKRGRFEFDTSLHYLEFFGTKEHPLELYDLFKKLGIVEKLGFTQLTESLHVYGIAENREYVFPFGIIEFMNKMEEYVPGSYDALKKFFVLAEESKEALSYIEQKNEKIDLNYLKKNFPDFLKVSTHTVDKVFDAISLPKKAQEILSSYWVYFGSPTSKLSFVHFAIFVFDFIAHGSEIPSKRGYEMSVLLAEEITNLGGKIKYLSGVKEILFKDKKIAGVLLDNDEIYESNHIIANLSPTYVYGSLIPLQMVPKEALQLTNSRVLGPRGFSIFLGLNQSAKDLGLTEYCYTLLESLDSTKEFQNHKSIKNRSSVVYVLNHAHPSCSIKGTTILEISSFFTDDVFSKNATEKNYFKLKSQVASSMIQAFENATGITITPYIEEIEIATPVTYARYTGHPDGAIYGYKATGMDNLLPRLLTMNNENYIPNLRFCGGFDVKLSGFGSTYLSGDLTARLTLEDMEKEGEEEWN